MLLGHLVLQEALSTLKNLDLCVILHLSESRHLQKSPLVLETLWRAQFSLAEMEQDF